MGLHTYGTMAVDWEERVRFDRLREERLAQISSLLTESERGALLCFDMTNIRYITATHIGTWAQDKLNRFCLLPQRDEPIMWDFGSAARHHQLYNPWLGDGRSRAGMRENECVGLVNKVLYDMGSEFVEGVNAISGERCSPHPHVYTDRTLRPGDPAYFDILHSFMGYRTCYYRTFAVASASTALVDAYKRCRYYLDAAIDLIRPGVTTGDVAEVWPKAEEFGFPDEEAAFALQFGHGVGLAIWEKPIFSRLVSLDHPEEIKEGMVFALETFWPSSDGWSAARIEEQLVVTADGCEVITRFPSEDLVIAGKPYYTVGGTLPLERERESNLNTTLDEGAGEASPTSAAPAAHHDPYPRFSDAEMAARAARLDGLLAEHGAEHCLLYGA